MKFQPTANRSSYLSPRRNQKRWDDGKFKTGFAETEEYLVTPAKANEYTVQFTATETVESGERETISPTLFVPSAEGGELDDSGAGNELNCNNGHVTTGINIPAPIRNKESEIRVPFNTEAQLGCAYTSAQEQ